MDIQLEKQWIIEQLIRINDTQLIHTIKNLLDEALQQETDASSDIPQAHQELVLGRLEKMKQQPESLLDWKEAQKSLTV